MLKLGRYRHFKGNEYRVIGVARDSETFADMVVYQALDEVGQLWVRPLAVFLEEVEVDGQRVPRFKYLGE
ncbi:MAG TPA: DUF1653 domain-containing protein [bacterium]|nr:DUF1653 domain-containing protein [bacterium]HPT30115.1 DUF1653 domain-containing protein [bacterium]